MFSTQLSIELSTSLVKKIETSVHDMIVYIQNMLITIIIISKLYQIIIKYHGSLLSCRLLGKKCLLHLDGLLPIYTSICLGHYQHISKPGSQEDVSTLHPAQPHSWWHFRFQMDITQSGATTQRAQYLQLLWTSLQFAGTLSLDITMRKLNEIESRLWDIMTYHEMSWDTMRCLCLYRVFLSSLHSNTI